MIFSCCYYRGVHKHTFVNCTSQWVFIRDDLLSEGLLASFRNFMVCHHILSIVEVESYLRINGNLKIKEYQGKNSKEVIKQEQEIRFVMVKTDHTKQT